jgi:gliding motility-associated-like protein
MLEKVLLYKNILRCCLIAVCFFNYSFNAKLLAQNLLPDGSFEETYFFEYEFPFSAFEYLKNWKAASHQFFDSSLVTTPDLFREGGTLPATSPPSFWNVITGASDGKNYIGLTNIATQDGAFLPEAISSVLNEPLEAGGYYALNLDYRNKGKDNIHPSPMMCIEEELKKLVFFFDDRPVTVSLNELDNISTPSTERHIDIHTPSMKSYQVQDWEKVGTCFQAKGDEKYMALSMTTGRVKAYPPCIILDDHFDIFLHYYFDVDNIRLEKLPETFLIKTEFCKKRPISINLKDSLLLPPMLSPIYFSFNEEITEDIIRIDSGGQYIAHAHLDCSSIPILIEAIEVDCNPKFYIPNVFSPNSDGINDSWQIFLKSDHPLTDFKLTVFDKWGTKVFETQDLEAGWTGNKQHSPANAGTYIWMLQYTYLDPELGTVSELDSGELLLIR